ncbi:hypothetical protein [Nitrosomonas sp. Nm166]|uniref:hypothetical protein n=1 Tax=Nitrosomonas sp. Nm166 TaxID=1881054 RepID=UPI0008E9F441|nr:hypothetical protein [Nitrosomonas sp. Nm166]SFF12880.1 hypothetical protein SAMN05428977_105325 [Nitrosomonas sp. Nm166]
MKKAPWHESQGWIPWLILLTIFLLMAVGIKEGWFAYIDFKSHKDEIDGITKILSSLVLLVGGILAYLRFFKGRTLRPKLNILPSSGFITLENDNLHWIDVKIENCGSVSIWNHEIIIYATFHTPEPYCMQVKDYMPEITEVKNREHLIDVGETSHEHAFVKVPANVSAITYQILIKDHKGTIWVQCITVSNRESKD